ncbi:MAG: type II CRISPR RNA-guided endonuclease Cas9 [Nitrospirae bacterium]|nr:type II CRISPR RNA-guided endonuclease Cas9 [Nitrospirota bacterium]
MTGTGTGDGTEMLLGLDIGSASVGWALLKLDGGKFAGMVDQGVRVFDPGMAELEKDGKGKSRNLERRAARLARRLLERRARRVGHLAHILQLGGLLPEGELGEGDSRNEFFNVLDMGVASPYLLRARAVRERVEPFELGRAIYHLGQRRGFLSNRKAAPKKDDDEGKVYGGIGELRANMEEKGARTLGEYFAQVDPDEERIRQRSTHRDMYIHEFGLIWDTQKAHYPELLTDDFRKRVYRAIFHQRPLKSQKHLIGDCELEKGRKRAPWALIAAQRFRYLQKVNDLSAHLPGGEVWDLDPNVRPEERALVIGVLEEEGSVTFKGLKKMFKELKGVKFNLEEGGEERLPGNRTSSKLAKVFGDKWADMSDADKDDVVAEIRSTVKDEVLARRAMKLWGLSEEKAKELSGVRLEDDYCSFSRKAIEKLMPKLMEGMRLNAAIRELYPERWDRDVAPKDFLPPIRSKEKEFAELRNPIVERTLNEVRRVVNAIIRKHGKPDVIRIEMARELRSPAKERENTFKKNRENQKGRDAAKARILKETGITMPRKSDITKVLLAEECGWICPYTGKSISMKTLVENPQFDIEHIIPLDRSLDDSFINKTLCYHDENRHVKGGKTPYEVYHGTGKWGDIISRVKDFKGGLKDEKLRRFMMDAAEVEDYLAKFSSRQLNDTRYATVRAKEFLGLLYGGVDSDGIDAGKKRRVQAVAAGVTVHIRNVLDLNSLLGDGPGKTRDDHRHHAVDAIVTALATPGMVKALSDAAQRARGRGGRRPFDRVAPPWDGFLDDARRAIDGIVVSHRVDRRVRGALHKETFYGMPRLDEKNKAYVHQRVFLKDIDDKDVDKIIDPVIRDLVKQKLIELSIDDPKKAFKSASNLPAVTVTQKDDSVRTMIVKRVRLKVYKNTFTVGEGHGARYVSSDSIHHMAIFEVRDSKGRLKWDAEVVSLNEAYKRKRAKMPIIDPYGIPGGHFLFSLSPGEIIEIDKANKSGREMVRIRTTPQSKQLRFVAINDARKIADIDKKGQTLYPEGLRERNCRKVVVTPVGEVRNAERKNLPDGKPVNTPQEEV